MRLVMPLRRRAVLVLAVLAAMPLLATRPAAAAQNVAESFVDENIHKGLDILRTRAGRHPAPRPVPDPAAGPGGCARIAVFTLGQYRRTAPPDDVEAFCRRLQELRVGRLSVLHFARLTPTRP